MSDDERREGEHQVHAALASAFSQQGRLLVSSVTVAVTIDDQGHKSLSLHTAPDQRTWETLGLLEHVRLEYAAFMTEQRVVPDSDS
ncbi:hypothetical protein [Kribbella sp. CA-293567]|uniref:hypothetical protein n=1 Tax=Kribbella sp. CA-293567 TaxID=3002436 RepID=UPI0022DE1F2F|nr:hypothetical protein [Kribbella sp. CA-293567]WBQ03008.1 hypothetical protein OX958_23860 [Kribbella sp. CA-293567]